MRILTFNYVIVLLTIYGKINAFQSYHATFWTATIRELVLLDCSSLAVLLLFKS